MTTDLFRLGHFALHSGLHSEFKIDCDALNLMELKALRYLARQLVGPYRQAFGIPTGGLRFAEEMNLLADRDATTVVIADDVLTTGRSFEEYRRHLISDGLPGDQIVGVALFARGPCPQWVRPIFTLNPLTVQEQSNDDDFANPRVLAVPEHPTGVLADRRRSRVA